jgi:predicted DNA-binding transcriptional regulator YafY
VNRTDRLYAVVEELRAAAPRPRSARQLARKYEVSTRTIERDILALQDAGVPVYAETGRLGGYIIDPAFTLPPVNFTAPEMVAIAVSLAGADGTPFAYAARSALRKVLAAAPAGQLAEAAEMMDRIRLIGIDRSASCGPCGATSPAPAGGSAHPNGAHVGGAHPNGAPSSGVRPNGAQANGEHRNGADPNSANPHSAHPYGTHQDSARTESASRDGAYPARKPAAKTASGQGRKPVPLAIQEAIATRHVLLIDYRDKQGVVTAREVEPVALAGTQTHWYLMGWCRLRNAARAFRMDRIVAAVDSGEPAPHRSYADLNVDIPNALVRVPDLVG